MILRPSFRVFQVYRRLRPIANAPRRIVEFRRQKKGAAEAAPGENGLLWTLRALFLGSLERFFKGFRRRERAANAGAVIRGEGLEIRVLPALADYFGLVVETLG